MEFPEVTTHILLFNETRTQILLIKWKNPLGHKVWGFPGGHMKMREKVKDAVIREEKEETGYDIEINRLSVFAIRAHMSRFLTQNIIDGEFLTFPFHKVIFNPFTQLDLAWMT